MFTSCCQLQLPSFRGVSRLCLSTMTRYASAAMSCWMRLPNRKLATNHLNSAGSPSAMSMPRSLALISALIRRPPLERLSAFEAVLSGKFPPCLSPDERFLAYTVHPIGGFLPNASLLGGNSPCSRGLAQAGTPSATGYVLDAIPTTRRAASDTHLPGPAPASSPLCLYVWRVPRTRHRLSSTCCANQ